MTTMTIETILAGAGYADLPASPLQRAICRAADGLPIGDELSDDEVRAHLGCSRDRLGLSYPALVAIVAGVRSGKSFLAASGAIRDVYAADLAALKPHERPRHAIVAPTVDNAEATYRILRGIIEGSRVLSAMVVGDPTGDTIVLRRPDGRTVEIVVVAAHRGGMTLRSRWLAGATLDEVALFGAELAGAAVNAEEILRAAEARLLPRTQARIISSPMGRQGLLWELYRQHHGQPGRVLVVHAPTTAMNPAFPIASIEALRARDPDAAAREYDAAWIDGETSFISAASVDACVRRHPLVRPHDGGVYVAAMDSGTRGNAWTLVVGRAIHTGKGEHRIEIALATQWQGSKLQPLSPAATLGQIATILRPYHVTAIGCDQHAFDAHLDIARPLGLTLVQHGTSDRDGGYDALQSLIASARIELPPVPLLVQDVKGIRKILTPAGYKITLPHTPDGRHCDFAPALALVVARCTSHVVDTPEAKRAYAKASMVSALRSRLAETSDAIDPASGKTWAEQRAEYQDRHAARVAERERTIERIGQALAQPRKTWTVT